MRASTGLGLGLLLVSSTASAEPFPARAERLLSPGRTVASEDSAEALVLNPANLANMRGLEGRWTGVRCPDTQKVACGHAFEIATPVAFGIATGFRVDHVMPPAGTQGVGFPFNGIDYTWLTWGLAYKISDTLQVGGSIQWSYSTNPYADGLLGMSAGASWRPTPFLGFSAVAADVNGPSTQKLATGLPVLDRSFTAALAYRPFGTRDVELGLEGRYFDGVDDLRPRGVLAIDVPGFGRIRGDVEAQRVTADADRRGIVATAGAEIAFDAFTAGGGALFGNGLGNNQSVGQYATVSLATYHSPGIPKPEHAAYIRLESTPGTRSHVKLLRRLWKAAEDRNVNAITMVIRAEPASSYAHAEELADAFRYLRSRGKKVICSFEDAGAKALYACASADRVVINPAGGVRYSGIRTTHMYLAGLLKKIGIKAEFVRVGAHKGAPEQFMNEHASDVARADQEDLLANHDAVFARNMALYRHIPEAEFRAISAKGPFIASEARDAKLVDGYAFDDELQRVTEDVLGHKTRYVKLAEDHHAAKTFGVPPRIGLLYIDGDIIDGRSRTVPILDTKLVGSYTIADSIKQLRDDPNVKAVVLRIESPGGSSMASDVMWRELKKLNEVKPLIVSMGSIAASGGYYVAAPARQIFALPLTITGSIGVYYGKADVAELLGKLGVNIEVRRTNPRADAESLYRGFSPDEKAELEHKVHQFYDTFLGRVAEGRHMSKESVDAIAQGRVWAGQQALVNGLVDRMGGLREALAAARAAAHLPDDVVIQEYPPVEQSLLDYALNLVGLKAGAQLTEVPVQIKEVLRAVAPLAAYGDGQALARMEWVPLEDTLGTEDEPDPRGDRE